MKKIKVLFFALAMTLSVTSCLEEKPLENDPRGVIQTFTDMQKEFVKATNNITPMAMGKDEWALFRVSAKLYAGGQVQGLGYRAAQVLEADNNQITVEGKNYRTRNLNIAVTEYKEPVNGGEPEIELQKEWACKFVYPPYYFWYTECDLPPEQNAWVFAGYAEPANPIFFSFAKYTKREKLPQKLIDEGRCYNFENCELDVNYLEYDMWGKDANGVEKRIHYVTSFSGELPYLATNLKTCYTTLFDLGGESHPGEVCQELVNFKPGIAAPAQCPEDPNLPCE